MIFDSFVVVSFLMKLFYFYALFLKKKGFFAIAALDVGVAALWLNIMEEGSYCSPSSLNLAIYLKLVWTGKKVHKSVADW